MRIPRLLSISVASTALAISLSSSAQRAIAPQQGSEFTEMYELKGLHFSVHAAFTDQSNAAGPNLDIAITNTAPETTIDAIVYPRLYAIQVKGPQGDVLPTLIGRQTFGPLLEGDTSLRSGGFEPVIVPGSTFTRHYRLSYFYKLVQPGDYAISFVALDEQVESPKGTWVRSEVLRYHVP